jgi:hypothetical protein
VAKDSTLLGAETTLQAVVAMAARAVIEGSMEKIHGVAQAKILITRKVELMEVEVEDQEQVGQHLQETGILAQFEYCGELLSLDHGQALTLEITNVRALY